MAEFVHLHVHSDYSLADAAVSVKSLAGRAKELGMTALALTDHGNMFGIMEFISACGEAVKPIVGCEVYVSPGSRFDKKGSEHDNKYYHLVLLAASREGYFNLVKLCSFAYTEGFYYRPRIDEELLVKYHKGIIALSACVSGEIPRLIRAGKTGEAEKKALHYRDLFGKDEQGNPNFYLEIQDHGIPAEVLSGTLSQKDINREIIAISQKDINREIVAISRKTGIPLVATNDVHYLNQEDYIAHDVLLCIGTKKYRSEERRKKYYRDQFYFKTADEMAALFSEYPEAVANTVRIAERCNADVPEIKVTELSDFLPDFEIPSGFENTDSFLRHLSLDGLAKRYPKEAASGGERWQDIKDRLDSELSVIIQTKFTGYFLIVADFVNWAKEHDISVGPGRGSGAGSIVAYALRITDIDPLKYNLLFERFLNLERVSMPDFDIDFASEGRKDVINYVTEKYGNDKVGQVITFGTLGAKQVIKDVARVMEIPYDEAEKIVKLIPDVPKITIQEATDGDPEKKIEGEPKLREMEADPKYAELFALARKLEGLKRQSGIHAGGVVIGKSVLHEFVPLLRDSKTGTIVTQYDKNYLEKCGLVKMDILGVKTQDLIKHTEEIIHRRGGKYAGFNVETVPEDDRKTFKMLGEGNSFEVFQFESDGMQNVLKRAKPGTIEELIALNSLYRPGPMDNINQFIDCKYGRQKISYPDPSLTDILKETYGVIVYQEQVMQVARIIAGFTLGHADELRRAMGKKNMKKMVEEKEKFIAGAGERGHSEKKAADIFELLIPFAEYGFNKSHSAAYAVVAYRTAYLKANFPAEFMAANLTNEINTTDKFPAYIDEARRMGLAIDPPDVNHSDKLFTVVDGRIVYGLLGIKGVGGAPADEIVRCRSNAPYQNFMDFLDRVDVKLIGKSVIEKLIQTGAFDSFGVSREILLGNLEGAIEYAQKKKKDREFGQSGLFDDTDEKEYVDFVFEKFSELSRGEKLKLEKQLIGFYFSGHPLDEYRKLWERAVKVNLGKLDASAQGNRILVGIVKTLKTVDARGGKMAYVTLSDYNGEIEMIFFPRVWESCRDRINAEEVVIVRGKLEFQEKKDKYGFIADALIGRQEADTAIAEEDTRQRKREKFRLTWEYMADLKSGGIAKAERGSYTIMGILSSLRETKDKNGGEMAFGTLRDFEGDIDLVFFSRVWKDCRDLLTLDEFAALKGNIDPANDRNPQKPSFKVSSVADLPALSRSAKKKADAGEKPKVAPVGAAAAEETANAAHAMHAGAETFSGSEENTGNPPRTLHIRLDAGAAGRDENLFPLRNYLGANPGPCPVIIHFPADDGEKIIHAKTGITLDEEETLGVLKGCTGVTEAWTE